MSVNFLRISAEAFKRTSTSFKVGGGIRRKFSMRRASQIGAGMTFCFAFAFIVRVFIGIAGHNILASIYLCQRPTEWRTFLIEFSVCKGAKKRPHLFRDLTGVGERLADFFPQQLPVAPPQAMDRDAHCPFA